MTINPAHALRHHFHDDRDVTTGAWIPWTPVLSSSGTQPNLGSGGNFHQTGSYRKIGKGVEGWAVLQFGSSGAGAGTGNYRVSLPLVPVNPGIQFTLGSGFLYRSSDFAMWQMLPRYLGGVVQMVFSATHGGAIIEAGAAQPFAWGGNGDLIEFNFAYEAA